MAATNTILLIRHAEKPDLAKPGSPAGVNGAGAADQHSLTPVGWQRAGAWAELFAPSLPGAVPALPRPERIFASRYTGTENGIGSKSRRPEQTVSPLAAKLGLTVDASLTEGQERELVEALLAASGTVLVCWQHEKLPGIARTIPSTGGTPADWPEGRYNPILRFRRGEREAVWSYDQLVPLLLAADLPDGV
jgi:broad specificity phosphatase PhoE